MTKEYVINGMSCGGCAAGVKKTLENLPEVESADIQLTAPQGKLILNNSVKLATLQKAIGHYEIQEI